MNSPSSPRDERPARRPAHRAGRRRGPLRQGITLSRRHAPGLFDALIAVQVIEAIALVGAVHQVSVVSRVLMRGHDHLPTAGEFVVPGLLLAATLAVSGACAACQPAIQSGLGERLAGATAADVLGVAGALPLTDFDRPDVLDRLKRVEFGAFVRPGQLAFGLSSMLSGVVGAAALTVGVLALAPWLALVAVVGALPLWWAAQRDGTQNYQTVRGLSRLERRRMYLAGLLTRREHAAEVRAFDLAPTIVQHYRDLSAQRLHEVVRTARARLLRQVAARATGGALLLAGVAALLGLAAAGRITLAQAVAAGAAGAALRTRLADTASGVRQLQEAAEFVDDHTTLLADFATATAAAAATRAPARAEATLAGAVPTVPTVPTVPAVPAVPTPAEVTLAEVTLRGVGLTYPGMTRPALHSVDLTLRTGEVVALVGANGSGKSTLAAIVAGLLPPTVGTAHFRGSDGHYAPGQAWRADIAVLLQDAGRYQESLRDNIAFGDVLRPADDDGVRRAIDAAGAGAVLDLLGDDLEASLGREQDGGIELSGGQWQRVALARVLYRGGHLLVLDEPSAPLDPVAEHDLVGRLRRSFTDRAVLLVTHRMAAAASADRVVVLDGGRVVEQGHPDDLFAHGGAFARMRSAEDSLWSESGVGCHDHVIGRNRFWCRASARPSGTCSQYASSAHSGWPTPNRSSGTSSRASH